MDILIYSVEQQKRALLCLQASLLETVLLHNCTCTLHRDKDKGTIVCVVFVKLCNLFCTMGIKLS